MKAKYQYRTVETEQDTDDVTAKLNAAQEDGYEYVSGPVQTRNGYVFLMRCPVRAEFTMPALNKVGIAEDTGPSIGTMPF